MNHTFSRLFFLRLGRFGAVLLFGMAATAAAAFAARRTKVSRPSKILAAAASSMGRWKGSSRRKPPWDKFYIA